MPVAPSTLRGSTLVVAALLQLLAPLVPIFQALPHARLEAAVGGLIDVLRLHLVGPIILAGEALVGVMIVGVALAVADVLHELCRCVEDMHWRQQRARLLRRRPRFLLG